MMVYTFNTTTVLLKVNAYNKTHRHREGERERETERENGLITWEVIDVPTVQQ